jgi:hypothetical protein
MNIYKYFNFNLFSLFVAWISLIHMTQPVMGQVFRGVSIGSGLQNHAVIDRGYSPLKYAGLRSVVSLNYDREATVTNNYFSLTLAQGANRSSGGNTIDTRSINMTSQIFFHSAPANSHIFLLGFSLHNEINQRFHQSFSNFNNRMDYVASLGPAIGYIYPLLWEDRKLRWKTTVHMQGIGFKVASDYISSEPPLGELIGEHSWYIPEIFRIGRDWSMGSSSELRFVSNSGNSMAIQHQFDFQQLSVAQEVMRVRNSILFNICVRL